MNAKILLYFLIIIPLSSNSQSNIKVESTLETISIKKGMQTIIHSEEFLFETPNWTPHNVTS